MAAAIKRVCVLAAASPLDASTVLRAQSCGHFDKLKTAATASSGYSGKRSLAGPRACHWPVPELVEGPLLITLLKKVEKSAGKIWKCAPPYCIFVKLSALRLRDGIFILLT